MARFLKAKPTSRVSLGVMCAAAGGEWSHRLHSEIKKMCRQVKGRDYSHVDIQLNLYMRVSSCIPSTFTEVRRRGKRLRAQTHALVSLASFCMISMIMRQAAEQPSGVEWMVIGFSAAPAFSFR